MSYAKQIVAILDGVPADESAVIFIGDEARLIGTVPGAHQTVTPALRATVDAMMLAKCVTASYVSLATVEQRPEDRFVLVHA